MDEIVNRVASSTLVTIDLNDYYTPGERLIYDLKDNLFQGLILKEKDFRDFLKNHDWEVYRDKHVGIICSTDAIIPTWAYMLLTTKLAPVAKNVIVGNQDELELYLFSKAFNKLDIDQFSDQRIVIKGCTEHDLPASIYSELTNLLLPYVKSIMFGEPCSTVPVYKKPKNV